jgi:hypothetical protein
MSLGGWSGRPAAARESADGEPLEVIATARLHLGLWEIRPGEVGCYGGLGLMLEEPKLLLRLTRSDRWQIDASPAVAARLTLAAETWRRARGVASLPPLKVRCEMELPEHRGLGSGTQTQVAMAWGLERFSCSPAHWQPPTTASLSRLSGRGRRSFVGLHGFLHGGFVVDRGEVAGAGQDGRGTSEACSRATASTFPPAGACCCSSHPRRSVSVGRRSSRFSSTASLRCSISRSNCGGWLSRSCSRLDGWRCRSVRAVRLCVQPHGWQPVRQRPRRSLPQRGHRASRRWAPPPGSSGSGAKQLGAHRVRICPRSGPGRLCPKRAQPVAAELVGDAAGGLPPRPIPGVRQAGVGPDGVGQDASAARCGDR